MAVFTSDGRGFTHHVISTDSKVSLKCPPWGDFYLMPHDGVTWVSGWYLWAARADWLFGADVPVF